MNPFWESTVGPGVRLYHGDVIDVLRELPANSVHCVVTSPPYWGLRDYGTGSDKELGSEGTPQGYVMNMVDVFREVRRVLRDEGTVWMNLGDSYSSSGGSGVQRLETLGEKLGTGGGKKHSSNPCGRAPSAGLKVGNLVGIPWRVALALQADGWVLRQDIIWHKPSPMPESVTSRCTKAHEYLFLLTKGMKYFYDADAIREKEKNPGRTAKTIEYQLRSHRNLGKYSEDSNVATCRDWTGDGDTYKGGRNKRSVWTITREHYFCAHFATFPRKLVEPCILAGCPVRGTVLDPFVGSGTTCCVAIMNNRRSIGIDLSEPYLRDQAIPRIKTQTRNRPALFEISDNSAGETTKDIS